MKKFLKTLLRVSIGLAIGIVLSDIGLRMLGLPRFYKLHTFPPQFASFQTSEGALYYASMPSTQIVFEYDGNPRQYFGSKNEVAHSTNSWGFRGHEFSEEKAPNTFRIAFLGDSVTFGEGVKDGDTFPEQTVLLLEKELAPKGRHVEGYNFGVGGYNTEQEIALLKEVVLTTSPDAIILGYSLNDAEPALFSIDADTGQLKRRPRDKRIDWRGDPLPDGLLFRPRIVQLFWQALSRVSRTRDTAEYYSSLYKEDAPGWQATKQALGEFGKICDENDIPCWAIIFPLLYRLDETYPFAAVHDLVKAALSQAGSSHLQVIDAFDLLKGKKDTTLWVHPTDQHPNERVHRIVAEALAQRLRPG
jgi:lysophospholipase L1-like esterase